jgi:hypothetical protein
MVMPMIKHTATGIEMADTEQLLVVHTLEDGKLEVYVETEANAFDDAYVSFDAVHLIDFFKDVVKRYG